MLLKVCILLLIFFLVYSYFYRSRDSGKNSNHTDSEADSRFDISRVVEAQYRDIKITHKESDRRE